MLIFPFFLLSSLFFNHAGAEYWSPQVNNNDWQFDDSLIISVKMIYLGGGSSDIFAGDVQTTPRSIKNHMKSNIFSAPSPANNTGEFSDFVVKLAWILIFFCQFLTGRNDRLFWVQKDLWTVTSPDGYPKMPFY